MKNLNLTYWVLSRSYIYLHSLGSVTRVNPSYFFPSLLQKNIHYLYLCLDKETNFEFK